MMSKLILIAMFGLARVHAAHSSICQRLLGNTYEGSDSDSGDENAVYAQELQENVKACLKYGIKCKVTAVKDGDSTLLGIPTPFSAFKIGDKGVVMNASEDKVTINWNGKKTVTSYANLRFEVDEESLQELADHLDPLENMSAIPPLPVALEKPILHLTKVEKDALEKENVSLRAIALVRRQDVTFLDHQFSIQMETNAKNDMEVNIAKGTPKKHHYSWWVFPTDNEGKNELGQLPGDGGLSNIRSGITSLEDAEWVLANTKMEEWCKWLENFNKACEMLRDSADKPTIPDRVRAAKFLLGNDFAKLEYFWQFWLEEGNYYKPKNVKKHIYELTRKAFNGRFYDAVLCMKAITNSHHLPAIGGNAPNPATKDPSVEEKNDDEKYDKNGNKVTLTDDEKYDADGNIVPPKPVSQDSDAWVKDYYKSFENPDEEKEDIDYVEARKQLVDDSVDDSSDEMKVEDYNLAELRKQLEQQDAPSQEDNVGVKPPAPVAGFSFVDKKQQQDYEQYKKECEEFNAYLYMYPHNIKGKRRLIALERLQAALN